jgi:F0F1-type ATP synthase assembly protein I
VDYAIQLLLPILGGLFLGMWLTGTFGVSPLWTIVLAILGMFAGIGIMYKRLTYPELYDNDQGESSPDQPKPKAAAKPKRKL